MNGSSVCPKVNFQLLSTQAAHTACVMVCTLSHYRIEETNQDSVLFTTEPTVQLPEINNMENGELQGRHCSGRDKNIETL